MRTLWVAPFSVALLAATPTLAGDHGKTCSKTCSKTCDKPVQACLDGMIAKLKTSGFIGVELDDSGEPGALKVTHVIAGSPAEKVGIHEGDVLVALNGIRFSEENEAAMRKIKVPGNEVTCTIRRDGANREFKLTLVPMPADLMAKHIGEHMMVHANNGQPSTAKK